MDDKPNGNRGLRTPAKRDVSTRGVGVGGKDGDEINDKRDASEAAGGFEEQPDAAEDFKRTRDEHDLKGIRQRRRDHAREVGAEEREMQDTREDKEQGKRNKDERFENRHH